MYEIIIYFVGFFVTYLLIKFVWRGKDNNEWGDVRLTIFLSIFSWIIPIVSGIVFLIKFLLKNIKLPDKPPKLL